MFLLNKINIITEADFIQAISKTLTANFDLINRVTVHPYIEDSLHICQSVQEKLILGFFIYDKRNY